MEKLKIGCKGIAESGKGKIATVAETKLFF